MDVNAESASLGKALESSLFAVMMDFNAPQEARDAADRTLQQLLGDHLQSAIRDFQTGALHILDLVNELSIAAKALSGHALTGAETQLPALLTRAQELQRHFHDAEGMRTTHTSQQEADAVHDDKQSLAPPPTTQPLPPVSATGPVLVSPTPRKDTNYQVLADEYVRFFAGAGIKSAAQASVAELAAWAAKFKPRYEKVGGPLLIPWWFIAGIHMLESSFNFDTHLHNGDPLSARTFRVPAGRPEVWNPPTDWESSALDALRGRRELANQPDWCLPRALYRWEAYNGFGYRPRGVASPYLWSLSTIYGKGKFVGDGVFDANAESKQCGAATLLKFLHDKGEVELRLDFVDEGETALPDPVKTEADQALQASQPVVGPPPAADGSFEAFLTAALPGLKHFKPSEFLMMGSGTDNTPPPKELWPNAVDLARVLDELRSRLNQPIVLTCIYRNEAHNARIGGVQGSQHCQFRAADFVAKGGGPSDWAAILKQMRTEKFFQGGIGVYSNFVHVDTRGWNADWLG